MTTYQKSKRITEDEVMFSIEVLDFDHNLRANNEMYIKWKLNGNVVCEHINFSDFVAWMYPGKIDNYCDEGKGLIEMFPPEGDFCPRRMDFVQTARGTRSYTFQGWLKEFMYDIEADLITWKKSQS